jgi:hypothetical protein
MRGSALDALGLCLSGRNLPAGKTLADRIRTLRRRGLSQQTLAGLVGVAKPTLDATDFHAAFPLVGLNVRPTVVA